MHVVDDAGEASGEGWGDDAELVLDDGKQNELFPFAPSLVHLNPSISLLPISCGFRHTSFLLKDFLFYSIHLVLLLDIRCSDYIFLPFIRHPILYSSTSIHAKFLSNCLLFTSTSPSVSSVRGRICGCRWWR